tara:strand:- start:381 stop:749 length:369 start_codon:yes stop_codon:yes gene_type:complete
MLIDVEIKKEKEGEKVASDLDNKGARSYKGQIIGDSMAITINFKWLIQIMIATAMVVYSFWQLESRIQELERNMVLALQEIELHEQERKAAEEKHIREMQEQMDWYQQELNLNPFSWGKKKK